MIETALRSALIANATVAGFVETRVYPATAPDDAKRPYIIYRLANDGSGNTEDECTSRFSVEIYPETESAGYGIAVQLARAVSKAASSMTGQHDGVCIHSVAKPSTRDTIFRPTNQHGRLVDLFFRYTED